MGDSSEWVPKMPAPCPPKRLWVLCRYYMQGVCRSGQNCRFSHNIKVAPTMVCKFYLQGTCTYGANCRYDHIRPDYAKKEAPPRAEPPITVLKPSPDSGLPSLKELMGAAGHVQDTWLHRAAMGRVASEHNLPDNMEELGISAVDDDFQSIQSETTTDPYYQVAQVADLSHLPICSQFAAFGRCTKGDLCPKIHGDLCSICSKHILHPHRPEEAAEHTSQCAKRKEQAEAHMRSSEIECAICLEKVLLKPAVGERKFGLMNCEHAFCLTCIRGWRTQYSGFDVETALRTCPVCRVTTNFITPSTVWPSSGEEKDRIVNGYKGKLSTIDCRHFNRGNGTCPFGTSCFYRHMLQDGSMDEPSLRHFGTADGEVKIMKPVQLADFLDLSNARGGRSGGRR